MSIYYDQMMVMLQLYQYLNGIPSHPIFEVLVIFNDIESDLHDRLWYSVSMDLMKEETKTVQISQYLHSQPERMSTVLTRETKMSSIEEEDTLG